MSEEDPVYDLHPNGTLLKFYPKYHGAERRGVKRVYLRNSAHHVPFPDAPGENEDNSVKFFDMKMDNNLIDREDDIYFCKIAKFPTLETKHHLFGVLHLSLNTYLVMKILLIFKETCTKLF